MKIENREELSYTIAENIFKVVVYKRGEFDKFIDSIDDKMRLKIFKTIEMLSKEGNKLRSPFSKHLNDGIFELRCKVGNNISRILYFFCDGKIVVLTSGFIKKAQKTPSQEIKLAKKIREKYILKE